VKGEGTRKIGLDQEIGNEEDRVRLGNQQRGDKAKSKKSSIKESHSGRCISVGSCFETSQKSWITEGQSLTSTSPSVLSRRELPLVADEGTPSRYVHCLFLAAQVLQTVPAPLLWHLVLLRRHSTQAIDARVIL
jgi:hypothetical protein